MITRLSSLFPSFCFYSFSPPPSSPLVVDKLLSHEVGFNDKESFLFLAIISFVSRERRYLSRRKNVSGIQLDLRINVIPVYNSGFEGEDGRQGNLRCDTWV